MSHPVVRVRAIAPALGHHDADPRDGHTAAKTVSAPRTRLASPLVHAVERIVTDVCFPTIARPQLRDLQYLAAGLPHASVAWHIE